MKLHRFYIGNNLELKHDFWLHDKGLIHQWRNVLRFKTNQQIVLFDGISEERLYKIVEFSDTEAHLQLVTELKRSVPNKEVYLLWSLLKKDKNDWVVQKCTELGVSHFLPILSERCERTDLSQNRIDRWKKIIIEASEQCGRSDIPTIREPMRLDTAIDELKNKVQLLVAEQSEESSEQWIVDKSHEKNQIGVLIGPEGGWSDSEKELFKSNDLMNLNIHDFTLRAETAAIAAVTKIMSS